ncbi:sensor histidine kinase [Methylobacterium oryzae]|uniref:sensor histidine kinase n=1 Tax=Methylobacterium oryzae TaxID=334852 RepID=UPI002F34F029
MRRARAPRRDDEGGGRWKWTSYGRGSTGRSAASRRSRRRTSACAACSARRPPRPTGSGSGAGGSAESSRRRAASRPVAWRPSGSRRPAGRRPANRPDSGSGLPQAPNDYLELLDRDGRLITASEDGPALSAAGDEADAIGRPWIDAWTRPEDREAVAEALDRARIGRPSRFQAQSESGGALRWWDVAVTPIGAAPDRPERILAVSRDITDQKLSEARQTLLMQELAHRMKNTMAMVQAVATQTMRNAPSLEAAGEALAARLLALAKAHDVLLQGSFTRASLSGLVEGAVSLHGDGVAGRFRIAGPELTLGPRHGMTLALMLHELGTNAAKYGALSVAAGWVCITWNVAEAEGGQTLRFRWEESGGPPVTPPTRTGFGTRLIARSLAHSFGGTARMSYPREGAVLTFEAPLDAVMVA